MLTQEHFDTLKTAIIEAMDKHIARGGKIRSGGFFTYCGSEESCCPIGCLTGKPSEDLEYSQALSLRLGFEFSDGDMWAFISGFDDTRVLDDDNLLYLLGMELRAKYLSAGD